MVKIKICGITNLEDAIASVGLGCDALGFVFYKKSPRYITPKKAVEIIRLIPKHILKIGVFVNASEKAIKRISRAAKINILQFHGDESPEFCGKFKGYKIIKAFRVKKPIDAKDILKYKTFAYLFDTFNKTKIGGTGRNFDWQLIRHIIGIIKPIFLSGGLNERNVIRAIKAVHPEWLDVSSSVEALPGKKDYGKLHKFIKKVRSGR
jgi:phosphoribosylanthranilate isomerase